MARPPALSAEVREDVVLRVLEGRETAAQAARRCAVSEQSVANWKRRFLEAGRLGLRGEVVVRDAARDEAVQAELSRLKETVADLYVELRRCRSRTLPAARLPGQRASPGAEQTRKSTSSLK